MLKVQKLMDIFVDQRDEELHQLCSQSQADGAQLAVLSMQVQELISSMEARAKIVGRNLEEINGQFYCHRGEINHLKIREKEAKEKVDQLGGFIIGAGHEAKVFKTCLDRMEDNLCKCACTPLEVGEEFVSSEDEARTELSMHLLEEVSMWLPLWKIPFLSQSQLRFLHAALALGVLFLLWKRLKKLLSSVRIWMAC